MAILDKLFFTKNNFKYDFLPLLSCPIIHYSTNIRHQPYCVIFFLCGGLYILLKLIGQKNRIVQTALLCNHCFSTDEIISKERLAKCQSNECKTFMTRFPEIISAGVQKTCSGYKLIFFIQCISYKLAYQAANPNKKPSCNELESAIKEKYHHKGIDINLLDKDRTQYKSIILMITHDSCTMVNNHIKNLPI
jgi:hypothetical protein